MVVKKVLLFLIVVPLLFVLSHFLYVSIHIGRIDSAQQQLNYINGQMKTGGDKVLQSRYPEGYVFANALFAISVLNHAQSSDDNQRNQRIIERCIDNLLSEEGKKGFDRFSGVPYGVFYVGWTNYVLKKYLGTNLGIDTPKRDIYIKAHKNFNQQLIAIQSRGIQILDSYQGANWPADNMVAIASLPDSNKTLKQKWLQNLIETSTSDLGLIHHEGYDTETVKGSSSSMILYFMHEIDAKLASKQNDIFLAKFCDSFLGTQLIKESLVNNDNDVDSGPIIFGYGSSATIMNIITQSKLHNRSGQSSWKNINSVSLPFSWKKHKSYLNKKELMFDIFMFWAISEINLLNTKKSLKSE